ncbi:MAG: recombinase family protein [Planctomycetes bacterium]|nr:recombinase family protein [Planctomycetota bacterium]
MAAYIRVSTRRQNDGQRAEVMKWLDANGIDPQRVEWYCDKESGTTLKRPEFDDHGDEADEPPAPAQCEPPQEAVKPLRKAAEPRSCSGWRMRVQSGQRPCMGHS